ncbi:hypothetical protein MLD38_017770 [Melastoma candidum]|uniref:Uncharacterized protein n=1 Tax=Melastoma candidum TaxID=119954 RepID=A0ACB9QT17_9MYRT|nr:hypothetical protein MLD38_017770 [Melastoma candidum]
MGTLFDAPRTPLVDDICVTVHDSCLVFSPVDTPRRTLFLSNIDKVLNFDVQTLHFFPANPAFPPEVAAQSIKSALANLLFPYDFLSGRITFNPEVGRMEIDCNSAGAGFVVASCQHDLDDIGDLVYPNPAFESLLTRSMPMLEAGDHPLCIIQVTSFRCGGFAMGVQTNHATFDGSSFKGFLENLAALAGDQPLKFEPCNDRHLLAARSPPRVDFPHPELMKLDIPPGPQSSHPPVLQNLEEDGLDFKIFRLGPDDIANLKKRAKADTSAYPHAKVTGFNVVTAHIWRCKALSVTDTADDRLSTILYAIDIRPKLNPPLPKSYAGNAVLTAYATTSCKELEEGPLSKVVGLLSEGASRMTDEYARSAIDWGELHRGFPNGEFLVSSWWRLGFADVEYPWGKPRYSCPLVYRSKEIILLFPDMIDERDAGKAAAAAADSVNILVALPPKEMEKFECFFHKLLA